MVALAVDDALRRHQWVEGALPAAGSDESVVGTDCDTPVVLSMGWTRWTESIRSNRKDHRVG